MNTDIATNFEPMLAAGEALQQEFLRHLHPVYPQAFQRVGNFKYYDIVIPELNNLLLEVKQDLKSDRTGNLCIEYRCNNQPSGITVTKAAIWVMADADKFYCFSTEKLKDFLRANWYELRRAVGGDNKASELVLVNKKMLANQPICCSFKRDFSQEHLLFAFINYVIL